MNEKIPNFKKLPNPLSKHETDNLFSQFSTGDMAARDKIIVCNLRLVVNVIRKKFWNTFYDKNDLFEIGVIGLINAVDYFDYSKNLCFSTYATKCIENTLNHFLKDINCNKAEYELTTPISHTHGRKIYENDIKNENFIDIIDTKDEIYSLLEALDERDKQIIILYFGLFDNPKCTQLEIAKMFNISNKYVSLIIKTSLKKMKKCFNYNEKILTLK